MLLFFFFMSLSKARKTTSNLSYKLYSVHNARFQVKTRLDQFHIQIGNSSFFNFSLEKKVRESDYNGCDLWFYHSIQDWKITKKSIFVPRPTVQTRIIQRGNLQGYKVKPNLCIDQITKPNMSCATWLKDTNLQTELHHRHAVRWLMAWWPTMPEKPKSCSRITQQLLCG